MAGACSHDVCIQYNQDSFKINTPGKKDQEKDPKPPSVERFKQNGRS